jgi:hypothetical protein
VALPVGEAVELQHNANVIRQHRDLDLAAQSAKLSATTGALSPGTLPMYPQLAS